VNPAQDLWTQYLHFVHWIIGSSYFHGFSHAQRMGRFAQNGHMYRDLGFNLGIATQRLCRENAQMEHFTK
jgi:hypothetical protein